LWDPGDPGFNTENRFRNTQATYFLPSVDEWYKAAFYDPVSDVYFDYPTGSDTAPLAVGSGTDPNTAVWNQRVGPADILLAGGESPFGTAAQGGNVLEWQEGPLSQVLDTIPDPDVRAIRGEDWGLVINPSASSSSVINDRLAQGGANSIGFRVASIPEPAAIRLVIFAVLALLCSGNSLPNGSKTI
jgi:formylglycine-generating enzyme required for sulfatase activity